MTSELSPAFGSALPAALREPTRRLVTSALRLGPLPSHVAFVMDGNRRLARRDGLKTLKGHELGFQALKGVRSHEQSRITHTALSLLSGSRREQCDGLRVRYRQLRSTARRSRGIDGSR